VKLPGFHFRETMSGTWTRDGVTRPMQFTVEARARSAWQYLRDRKAELRGEVTMDGLATARPLEGEITIDPILGRLIRYEFAFAGDDGQRYRFAGQKDVTLRDLTGSMTTLPGELRGADGRALATALLKFDTRDLPRFLGSWRLDLF
jgi:hypothetical protein